MKKHSSFFASLLVLASIFLALGASAQNAGNATVSSTASLTPSTAPSSTANPSASTAPPSKEVKLEAKDDRAWRAEGARLFRTNCGRCHNAPHKFPPRVMATIVRHMRVRAMLTEDDMKFILRFMTE